MDSRSKLSHDQLDARALFRYRLVSAALAREARGEVRAVAVTAIAGTRHLDEDGHWVHVSTRSLYRWIRLYEQQGLAGICNRRKFQKQDASVLPQLLVDYLLAEKQADPAASIPEMLARAKLDNIPGAEDACRATVWRYFKKHGVPTRRVSSPKDRPMRRFAFAHRLEMVLCDGKHFRAGPKRNKRVVLFFIDDATRMALCAVVGESESAELFLRGLHQCITINGLMGCLFSDNGSGFIANDCKRVLANLNIRYIQGTPHYPEGRGKVERFNRTAWDDFLRHLGGASCLSPDCASLELRINQYLDGIYNVRPHSALEGLSPRERFLKDIKPTRFPTSTELSGSFQLALTRKVSKDLIVSIEGEFYEMPATYELQSVTLLRDLIKDEIGFIHHGQYMVLPRHDPHVHARRQPQPCSSKKNRQPEPPNTASSADRLFGQQFQALVDDEGNFHDDMEDFDDDVS